MEDKAFQLLEKMYIEFSNKIDSLSSEFSEFRKETNERFDKVDAKIKGLKGDVIRIENNHGSKQNALFDAYTQMYEKLTVIEKKVGKLSVKVDQH